MEKILLEKQGALIGQVLHSWGHFQLSELSVMQSQRMV